MASTGHKGQIWLQSEDDLGCYQRWINTEFSDTRVFDPHTMK